MTNQYILKEQYKFDTNYPHTVWVYNYIKGFAVIFKASNKNNMFTPEQHISVKFLNNYYEYNGIDLIG